MLGKVLERRNTVGKVLTEKEIALGRELGKQENSIYKSFGIELDEQSFSFSLFEPLSIPLSHALAHTHTIYVIAIYFFTIPLQHTHI